MGINGLIPFLKKASHQANIKEYSGCTVAVDSYCWLHRGAFACAEKLATGEKTDQYVFYCMKYVNNLLSYGIKPIMVFDGCRLPSKADEEKKRRERRAANRKKAAQLLRDGKHAEARKYLATCVDISPAMALELMNACRAKGVDCIVAPYEADAQLAYLSNTGIAQVIITEDSDLVLFGCKRVMFKMDFNGNGLMVEHSELNKAMELPDNIYSFEKFRYMCILSGCDYHPSLPGIGLGKARKFLKLTRQPDTEKMLQKLPVTLGMSSLSVTADYIQGFIQANNTFLHQLVFDPIKRQLMPLTGYPPDVDPEDMQYAGSYMSADKAFQIAIGNIDINTGKVIGDFDPNTFQPKTSTWHTSKDPHMLSIWNPEYQPMSKQAVKGRGDEHESTKPTTIGKTVMVKFTKRPRPVDLSIDESSLTDTDLLKAYDAHVEDTRPPSKRAKSDERAVDSSLHSQSDIFSLLDSNDLDADSDLEEDNSEQQNSESKDLHCQADSKKAAPTFDSSQTKYNNTRDSDDISKKTSSCPSRECYTPRNHFAVSGSLRKEKFNLNAKKGENNELRSRFFAHSKPLQKSTFFFTLEKEHKNLETPSNRKDSEDEEYSDLEVVQRRKSRTRDNEVVDTLKEPNEHKEHKLDGNKPDSAVAEGSSYVYFQKFSSDFDKKSMAKEQKSASSRNEQNIFAQKRKRENPLTSPLQSFGFRKMDTFRSSFDRKLSTVKSDTEVQSTTERTKNAQDKDVLVNLTNTVTDRCTDQQEKEVVDDAIFLGTNDKLPILISSSNDSVQRDGCKPISLHKKNLSPNKRGTLSNYFTNGSASFQNISFGSKQNSQAYKEETYGGDTTSPSSLQLGSQKSAWSQDKQLHLSQHSQSSHSNTNKLSPFQRMQFYKHAQKSPKVETKWDSISMTDSGADTDTILDLTDVATDNEEDTEMTESDISGSESLHSSVFSGRQPELEMEGMTVPVPPKQEIKSTPKGIRSKNCRQSGLSKLMKKERGIQNQKQSIKNFFMKSN